MNSNYLFLCGVMWCKFGQEDAGKELVRASDSNDPDASSLASAMFAKGGESIDVAGREFSFVNDAVDRNLDHSYFPLHDAQQMRRQSRDGQQKHNK